MNSEQIKDMHLLYNAVYNEELREQFEEYNNTIYDEDIVEVATEYFYSYGLNADGIDILIENVGLESFVEYVYELSEDLYDLTEARRARKRTGGESYAEVKAKIDAKEAAKRKVATAASEKREVERKEPESRGAESEAKVKQPKSKKPERKSIADRISNAIKSGVERHNKATATAGRLAGETGKTLGKLAKGVGHVAGQFGAGAETVAKASKKAVVGEEVEAWVNQLVEEGYDLSGYTWDEMVEIYLDESAKRTPKKVRGSKDPEQEMRGRSDAGKRISGDEKTGPRYYTLGRRVSSDTPTQPGEKPANTPKLSQSEKDEIQYRKANLKAGKTHTIGGKKGLPESYDMFDVILEYLVAEGYADTNESAITIMANMSEEWRDSIIG